MLVTVQSTEDRLTIAFNLARASHVVEQVEPDGSVPSARLVVDRQLFAWDLNDGRQVVPRGALIEGEFVESQTVAPGSPLAVSSRPTLLS
jgi:hypothetical protein